MIRTNLRRCRPVWCLCCALAVAGSVVAGPWEAETAGRSPAAQAMSLQLLDALPIDPLLAGVVRVDRPEEMWDQMLAAVDQLLPEEQQAQVDQALQLVDDTLGLSLRDQLLAVIGPELGLVVDLPQLDQLAGLLAEPTPESVSLALGRIVLLGQVRDREKLDHTLRHLFRQAGAEVTPEGAQVQVSLASPDGDGPDLELFYRLDERLLVLGFDATWVGRLSQGLDDGQRLRDGADFKRLARHLDPAPSLLCYLNLPKIRELLAASQMVQGDLAGNADAGRVAAVLLDPETVPMGMAGTVQQLDGDLRRVSYGPSRLAGGKLPGVIAAIAAPRLLGAAGRKHLSQTIAELRIIGNAIEVYAIDSDGYPTTNGEWADATVLGELLVPTYLREVPAADGWGNPHRLWSNGESYLIVSTGEDGKLEQEWTVDVESSLDGDAAADLVYRNGSLVCYPQSR